MGSFLGKVFRTGLNMVMHKRICANLIKLNKDRKASSFIKSFGEPKTVEVKSLYDSSSSTTNVAKSKSSGNTFGIFGEFLEQSKFDCDEELMEIF